MEATTGFVGMETNAPNPLTLCLCCLCRATSWYYTKVIDFLFILLFVRLLNNNLRYSAVLLLMFTSNKQQQTYN